MTAALFVGQSAASMRLPPCSDELMIRSPNHMIGSGLQTLDKNWIIRVIRWELNPFNHKIVICPNTMYTKVEIMPKEISDCDNRVGHEINNFVPVLGLAARHIR